MFRIQNFKNKNSQNFLTKICYYNNMHIIQKEILKKLASRKIAKYSEIKSKSMEGNLFSYHLNSLIKNNFIKKLKPYGYRLTTKSKILIQKLNFESFNLRIQPSILTIIVCKNKKGKFLMYKSSRHPNIGQWGFIAGKIHENETALIAAKREFLEKTNLSVNIQHRGIMQLTFYKKSEFVMSILTHIFMVKKYSGIEKGGDKVEKLE